jgi:rhamnose transport system permease protein
MTEVTANRPLRKRLRLAPEWALAGILVLVMAAMSFLSAQFLQVGNLLEMTRYVVEIGLLALPMTMIIITKGIDLSVGSNLAFSAVIFGLTWQAGVPWPAAALAGIGAGTLAGLLNGVTIAWIGVPPLVATLATFGAFRGIALGLSQGRGVSGFPADFFILGQGSAGLVPVQLIIFLLIALLFYFLLQHTAFGRVTYALGHSLRAVRFSGVRVSRTLLTLYTLSGTMAGLAAIINVSRVGTAKGNAGMNYELEAITAAVLGGTSIAGGKGSIIGTLLGLAIIVSLRFGMILGGVSANVRSLILGLALIVAVLVYRRLGSDA